MMKRLLDIDGPFLDFLEKVGQLIVVSGMWLLGCIPIVTICTSNAALYYAVYKSLRLGEGSAVKNFLKSYRENLLLGSAITLTLGAAGFVMLKLAAMLQNSGYPVGVLEIGCLFVVFLLIYIGPVLSRFRIGYVRTLKLTFVMSLQYAHYTLIFVLGLGIVAVLQFFVLPFPTVFIVPGLWCLATSFLMEKVLQSYTAKKSDENDW